MNKFSNTRILLDYIDREGRLVEVYNTIFCAALGAELRELLKLVPQPKLREYKGVTYQDGMWHTNNKFQSTYPSVMNLVFMSQGKFTDDDFIPLMDLKKNPYEEVTHNVFEHITDEQLNTEYFTRFADLLHGCSSKRLIAELESRGIHNQWKLTNE